MEVSKFNIYEEYTRKRVVKITINEQDYYFSIPVQYDMYGKGKELA